MSANWYFSRSASGSSSLSAPRRRASSPTVAAWFLATVSILVGAKANAAHQFIDLTPYVNHDGENLSKDYTNLPRDTVLTSDTLGTPFIIEADINGNIFIVGGSSVAIDFNDHANTVHFIGQIHYGVPNNQIIGSYTINYADLSSVVIELDNNINSPNWNIDDHCCNWRQASLPNAPLAWIDSSTGFKETLLRELVWTNPFPHLEIATIDFARFGNSVSPVLGAVSYSPVPLPATLILLAPALLSVCRYKLAATKENDLPPRA